MRAYHAASGKRRKVYTDSVVGQIYWDCGIQKHTEDLHRRLSVTVQEKKGHEQNIQVKTVPLTNDTLCDSLQQFAETGNFLER